MKRFAGHVVAVMLLLQAAQDDVAAMPPKALPFLPIADEAPPRLFVDKPLPGPLAQRNVAIIPYRTENFRILPVFGEGAADISPRAGHLHVAIDGHPWRWADTGNNDAIVIVGLPPGRHSVKLELASPVHEILAGQTISFVVPAPAHRH